MGGFMLGVLAVLLFLLSLFLVFIIMIQRGKGGGIAGSLTGTAQSAFGARGGDLLMWWTIGLTGVWIMLSGVTIFFYSSPSKVEEDQGGVQDEEGASTSNSLTTPDNSPSDLPDSLINATDAAEDLSNETLEQPDVDEADVDEADTNATDVNTDDASVEPEPEDGEAAEESTQDDSSEE